MRKKTLFFCSSLSCFAWTSGGEGTIFQRQPRWRPDFFKKGVYVQCTFNIIQIINWKNCEFQNPKDHLLQTFHESFGGVSICEETASQGSWMDPCIPAFFFFGGGEGFQCLGSQNQQLTEIPMTLRSGSEINTKRPTFQQFCSLENVRNSTV